MRFLLLALFLAASATGFAAARDAAGPLTLASALAQANARNQEVVAARREVDVALAVLSQAVPAPLRVQIDPGLTQDAPGGRGTLQTFSAGASQELLPSLGAQRRIAASGVDIARARLGIVTRDVDQRVIAAYYGLASAQAIVAAAGQSVANAKQLEKDAKLRLRVGASGSFEVLRAQVELRRAQTNLFRARARERLAAIALNVLLGADPAGNTTVELALEPISGLDPRALYAQAERTDPQIAQYRAMLAQAYAQQRAAELQRDPSIGLQGGYMFQRVAGSSGTTSHGPTASVTVSLPLVDFGTIRGAVREARFRQAAAQAALRGRSAELQAQILQDVAELESSQARLSFSQTSLKQAQEGLRLAQFGYARGALGVLDVLSARNELAAAQAEVTQASADFGAALARLHLISGVPISP